MASAGSSVESIHAVASQLRSESERESIGESKYPFTCEGNVDPVSALKTGSEAISLVSALAKLINEAKTRPSAPLRELLARLQIDAIRLSRDLENRLRGLIERSYEYGLNPSLSLDQQLKDLNWYNVVTRSRLKSFREECTAIYRQLTSFIDDATALMLCEKDQQVASSAFVESLDTKRQLDGLFMKADLPLSRVLDGLLATASRVSADLQAS